MAPPRKHDTDAILDATRELVLREGARAASVNAIAAASGAPAGTLYSRFGSRDGVLAAAWLRALERFQELALAAAAEPGPTIDVAVGMARAAVRFAHHQPDDALLLLTLRRKDLFDSAPGSDLRERLAAMNAPLEAQFVRFARELGGRADVRSIEAVTRAVVDLPHAAVRRHAGPDGVPPWVERDVGEAAHSLLQSLTATGAER